MAPPWPRLTWALPWDAVPMFLARPPRFGCWETIYLACRGLFNLPRQTVHVIRQNLFWSLIFNSIGIGLAVTGRLNPIWASAAMMLSSFLVIANSLRLGTTNQTEIWGDADSNPANQDRSNWRTGQEM